MPGVTVFRGVSTTPTLDAASPGVRPNSSCKNSESACSADKLAGDPRTAPSPTPQPSPAPSVRKLLVDDDVLLLLLDEPRMPCCFIFREESSRFCLCMGLQCFCPAREEQAAAQQGVVLVVIVVVGFLLAATMTT